MPLAPKTPEQMKFDLPKHEGKSPGGIQTNISGKAPERFRPIKYEERGYVVCEYTCEKVGHDKIGGTMVRVQDLKVLRMAEIDQAIAEDVLASAEDEVRRFDEANARDAGSMLDADGKVDPSAAVNGNGDKEADGKLAGAGAASDS